LNIRNVSDTSKLKAYSSIAITQRGEQLYAACVKKHGADFELIWTKTSEPGQTDFSAFAEQIIDSHTENDQQKIVAGFNAEGVVFYRLQMPKVASEELATMVKLQAESKFPLPAEEMVHCWQSIGEKNKNIPVTVAAARKALLDQFASKVKNFDPDKILLDSQGIVQAWHSFFGGNNDPAIIVDVGRLTTRICLALEGKLAHSVTIDAGSEDFQDDDQSTDRFAQDCWSVSDLFGAADLSKLPVFVLSDGSSALTKVVSSLTAAGFGAKEAEVDLKKLKDVGDKQQVYHSRAAIGLAAIALNDKYQQLDLFASVYTPMSKQVKKSWLLSPRLATLAAAAALILLVVVSYAVDVKSLKDIKTRVDSAESIDCAQVIAKNKMIKIVAAQRGDVLGLLKKINTTEAPGITLNSINYKRGQKIAIAGQAQSDQQLYQFQKNLLSNNLIESVDIESVKKDPKGGKLNFTISFHYSYYTKKIKGTSLLKGK
jgi:Tfp pilus assembly protein PilN